MKYIRHDSIVIVAEIDGRKMNTVYTLDFQEGDRSVYDAGILVTTPIRNAQVDASFDLNSIPEPIDYIPNYVYEELLNAENEYADIARDSAALAINVMDCCIDNNLSILDDLYLEGCDRVFGMYETSMEARS